MKRLNPGAPRHAGRARSRSRGAKDRAQHRPLRLLGPVPHVAALIESTAASSSGLDNVPVHVALVELLEHRVQAAPDLPPEIAVVVTTTLVGSGRGAVTPRPTYGLHQDVMSCFRLIGASHATCEPCD